MALLLIVMAVLTLGARFFPVDTQSAEFLVRYFSYYDNWVLVLAGLYLAIRAVRRHGAFTFGIKKHALGLCACLAVAVVWQVSNQAAFKMLMDELALAAVAKTYFEEREAMVPHATVQVGGEVYVATSYVDKRPTLYPFVVSLLHTYTGYRPENSFMANALISLVFLGLIYGWASTYYSEKAGICAVMLVGAIPLFAQQATSGGYDLLNATALVGLLWAGTRFCERRDADSLMVLVWAGLCFARCRYESLTGLAVVGLLWLVVCIRERKVILNRVVAVSPLMAVMPLMSNMVLLNSVGDLEKPVDVPTFSVEYFSDNLGHAIYYLFGMGRLSNAPLAALLGVVALFAYAIRVGFTWKESHVRELGNGAWILWVSAISFLFLFYFWGNWADGFATRFSMPLLLLLCLSPVLLSRYYGQRYINVLLCICVVHFTVWYRPFPDTVYTDSSSYYRQENGWWMDFVEQHGTEQSLFIGDNILGPYMLNQPGILMGSALKHHTAIRYALETGYYKDIYILSRHFIDPGVTRKPTFYQERLLDTFELETMDRFAIRDDVFSMIYRVKAVKAGPELSSWEAMPNRRTIDYALLPGFYPGKDDN